MKKMKFNVGADAADAEFDQSGFYDGEVPPKGVYRVKVKNLRMKTNKNDDPMINGIAEIAETKKSGKDKFNGYGIWFNINVTKQSAPFVNNFLDAAGFNKKAFWGSGGVTIDENDGDEDRNIVGSITKIGTKTVADEIPLRLRTKRGKWDGEDRLEVAGAGFLGLAAGDDEEEQWDEDEDDDSTAAVADEDAEDESDEDEEEADDEEEEDEEDEEAFSREDLDGYDRAELKTFLKEWAPDFKVLKKYSDDDLRDAAWGAYEDAQSEEEDDEEEEDGEAPF